VAALNLPHTFQPTEVLTAANLNDNFGAVKTEVEALQAVSLPACQWLYNSCSSPAGIECQVICPAGTHPLTGGCDAVAGTSISENRPSVGAVAFPPTPAPPSAYDRWVCEGADGVIQSTYALCCPVGN
jgi:hypothetical protein